MKGQGEEWRKCLCVELMWERHSLNIQGIFVNVGLGFVYSRS